MLSSSRLKSLTVAFVTALTIGAMQGSANADPFRAPLLQCTKVTTPALLSTCAAPSSQDPIGKGEVRIADDGDLEIAVNSGGATEVYTVSFRSPDGSKSAGLGTLSTDANGNGKLQAHPAIAGGKAGAGIVVLSRSGSDQYVSGIAVEPPQEPDFQSPLVACAAVNFPAGLAGCGTDKLKSGRVQVDGDNGTLMIQLQGAQASKSYSAVLRAPNGTELMLGTFGTDSHGNGQLMETGEFSSGTVASGTVVLKRGGSDQFLGGFKVNQRPTPPPQAKSGLVRCLDVSAPALTDACGTDPLSQGIAQTEASGKLHVNLTGAAPNTKYEVFYRPLDRPGPDVDTMLSVATDQNGNGDAMEASSTFETSGKIGSGSFIVKGGGLVQFVPGFLVK